MAPTIFPWQSEVWQQLQAMRERLPHAILFHGQSGIGKAVFAEAFAQSLLCEARLPSGHACGACLSCGWFAQYGHPDYRRVRPEVLDDDASAGESDNESRAGTSTSSKASKTPSKDIRIEQVRALADFMNISTHRQGRRVVLLYPAEALNSASANALLKTLEEPPPATVFLLVSNNIERLLPTMLSRCRQIALPMPGTDEALAWLSAQGIGSADAWLAEQGGAPLTALTMAQMGSRDSQDELLAVLMRPTLEAALKTAERLQKSPLPELVLGLQRWLYDLCSFKSAGKVRYYPSRLKELSMLADRVTMMQLLVAVKQADEHRAVASHPLSARLFIEDMLLDYSALFS